MILKTLSLFITFLIMGINFNAHASSCCGGGSSTSLIIVGDKKSELSLGFSLRDDYAQSDTQNKAHYIAKESKDITKTLNVQFAYQLTDYSQIATKFSVVTKEIRKSKFQERSTGLGDFDFQYSYEFLPEYDYSAIRPRGFIYVKFILPTTRNMFNSQEILRSDVRGFGYYGLTLGSFFVKKINNYNLRLGADLTHYFSETHNELRQSSFNKFTIPLGISYDLKNIPFSIGITDTFNYQTAKKSYGKIESRTHQEQFWDINLFVNYSPNPINMYTFSYSDSGLIGKSINSPLYRSYSINYTRSWEL